MIDENFVAVGMFRTSSTRGKIQRRNPVRGAAVGGSCYQLFLFLCSKLCCTPLCTTIIVLLEGNVMADMGSAKDLVATIAYNPILSYVSINLT